MQCHCTPTQDLPLGQLGAVQLAERCWVTVLVAAAGKVGEAGAVSDVGKDGGAGETGQGEAFEDVAGAMQQWAAGRLDVDGALVSGNIG